MSGRVIPLPVARAAQQAQADAPPGQSASVIRFPVERRTAQIVADLLRARDDVEPREVSLAVRRALAADPVLRAAGITASVRLRRISDSCEVHVVLDGPCNGPRETATAKSLRSRAEAIRKRHGRGGMTVWA